MSIFKSLLKRTEEDRSSQANQDFLPDLYSGMKVEVLTPANALIFVGKLRVLGRDLLELRAEAGGYLPRALYNQPVKLRVFQRDGSAFTLNGIVSQNSFDCWRVEKLKYLQNSENRSFFRQNTGVSGWVYPITSSKGQKFSCKVLDVSAGGARVITDKLIELGGAFRLEAALLPNEEPFLLTCQVTRILVRSQTASPVKKYEYGCQFTDLSPREQDRLLQAIFTLQRKVLQARRDQ